MNKRTQELAKRCWDNRPEGQLHFDNEKFAELIVRECMEVCADRGKQHDGLYSAWAVDCSERIGKRFGVE